MFHRIFCLVLILSWVLVNTFAADPSGPRKAALALKPYRSYPQHNPIVYSLLNVLIHNKQARAFISDKSIDMALDFIKEFDQKSKTNSEPILRQLIYPTSCKTNPMSCLNTNKQKVNYLPPALKERIIEELDKHFPDDD